MGQKKSVYFGEPIERLLEQLGADNVSGAINGAVDRYLAIVQDHLPALSKEEWCCVMDVMNGTIFDSSMARFGGRGIAINVSDSKEDGTWEKWGVDGDALVKKLAGLSTAESIAVLHAVAVFWAHSSLATDDALALAGIKF